MRILTFIAVLSVLSISPGCNSNKTEGVAKVTKEHRIMDDGNLLTPEQEDTIYALIQDLETNIGSQIAVLTLESLGGQPINDLSLQIANEMHLGRKDYDDGVLIIVAA
ncbi:MAG TPA: TPM domain-containing protein, partial [Chryseolinea sp.]